MDTSFDSGCFVYVIKSPIRGIQKGVTPCWDEAKVRLRVRVNNQTLLLRPGQDIFPYSDDGLARARARRVQLAEDELLKCQKKTKHLTAIIQANGCEPAGAL